MTSILDLTQALLYEGHLVLESRPSFTISTPVQTAEIQTLLREAFESFLLTIIGPPLEYRPKVGLEALRIVSEACWFLVSTDEDPAELTEALTPSWKLADASAILSADLLFRYLPAVHRRARAKSADDVLTKALESLLLTHPLSGLLSDIREAPSGDLGFAGHLGLMTLYAERFTRHPKPNWKPTEGELAEVVEWVTQTARG